MSIVKNAFLHNNCKNDIASSEVGAANQQGATCPAL